MSKPDLGGFAPVWVPGLYGPDMGGFPAARTWGTLTGPDMGGFPAANLGPLEAKFAATTNPYGTTGMSVGNISAVAWGGNTFVAVGNDVALNSAAIILSRDNGQTWAKAIRPTVFTPAARNLTSIAYSTNGAGMFVGFGTSVLQYAFSPDGDNWAVATWTPGVLIDNITFVGGSLIACASAAQASIYVSRDNGQNWTTVTMPVSLAWRRPAISPNGTIVICANASTATYISIDGGFTWTLGGVLGFADAWGEVVYGDFAAGGVFLVHTSSINTRLCVSFDYGVSWTSVTGLTNGTRESVVYWNQAFYAFGLALAQSTIEVSTNQGLTWTTSPTTSGVPGQFITRASPYGYFAGIEATNPVTKLIYGALGSPNF